MNSKEDLGGELEDLLKDWTLSEIVEGLAGQAAYWKRHDDSPERWDRARKMLLKTAVVLKDISL